MSLKIDRLQLEIIINNDQARKQLRSLEEEARQINKELKGIAEGTDEWVRKTDRLKSIKQQMDGIYEKIGITGLSLKELTTRQKELNLILRQMDPRLPQYKEYSQQLQAINNRISELRGKAHQAQFSFKGLADSFNRYFAIVTAGIATITGMVFSIKQMISAQAELTDSLANIRKSTGMTAVEVEKLNAALGKIDTRTSRQELRQMAVVAGQLGIAKEDIYSFVQSVDKLNVALGDEFQGGAEEVAREMGMLRNVLSDIRSSNVSADMLRVGNAINTLGAAGFATGPVMTDFASRIGGMGIPLGLTSDEVLGLSATLQELNVHAERGGTAVVKILQKMTTNTDSFAAIAGMQVKEFSELVNSNLYGAFLKVIEGSKQSGTSATALAAIIKDLEISGVGASEIFAKLGTNTSLLAEKVALAGSALQQTDSVMNEFNIKNATLGAVLAKLQKDFYSLITMPGVTEFFKNQVFHIVELVRWMKDLPLFIEKYRIALITVTGATLAWIAAKTRSLQLAVLNNLTLKEGILLKAKDAILLNTLIIREELLTIWKGKGTIATKMAATAQLAWNAALRANPIGVAITAITALVAAIRAYDKYNGEALRNEQVRIGTINRLNTVNSVLAENYNLLNDQIAKLNKLSVQEKLDLQDKIDKNIQLARTELVLMEARQKKLFEDNAQATLWQKVVNLVASGGNAYMSFSANALDAAANGKKASDSMNDGIEELKSNIKSLESAHATLSDIMNAEQQGDQILAKTKEALTERLSKYQVALRNTVAGSEDFHRIQGKIKTINQELARFDQESVSEKTRVISRMEDLNEQIKQYNEQLQMEIIRDPQHARVIADKIARLKKYREGLEEVIANLQKAADEEGKISPMASISTDDALKNAGKEDPFTPKPTTPSPGNESGEDVSGWALKANQFITQYAEPVLQGLLTIDQAMTEYENRQLAKDSQINEQKKANLKRQLDAKLISQKQYDEGVARLDADLAAKTKALQIKQAKRQKEISLVQAIINTAQAVTSALSMQPFIVGLVMSILAGALGAVQIGLIASTPIPEAAKGRYKALERIQQAAMGRYDVIGQSDGKYYGGVPYEKSFTGIPGRPLLVNETGNEIVIDPFTTKNIQMNYPYILDAIEMARVPQRASGQYPESARSGSMQTTSIVTSDPDLKQILARLADHLDRGISAPVVWDDIKEKMQTAELLQSDVAR